jgi:hypothetical protein
MALGMVVAISYSVGGGRLVWRYLADLVTRHLVPDGETWLPEKK